MLSTNDTQNIKGSHHDISVLRAKFLCASTGCIRRYSSVSQSVLIGEWIKPVFLLRILFGHGSNSWKFLEALKISDSADIFKDQLVWLILMNAQFPVGSELPDVARLIDMLFFPVAHNILKPQHHLRLNPRPTVARSSTGLTMCPYVCSVCSRRC